MTERFGQIEIQWWPSAGRGRQRYALEARVPAALFRPGTVVPYRASRGHIHFVTAPDAIRALGDIYAYIQTSETAILAFGPAVLDHIDDAIETLHRLQREAGERMTPLVRQ